ncbi:hypothetical protein NL676_013424 [Syzygium grande]|nr:hypothetical protein NL676_013424 [Syzygium grande]
MGKAHQHAYHHKWCGEHATSHGSELHMLDNHRSFLQHICVQEIRDINEMRWWGLELDDHCPLASCPTAPGIQVKDCPIFH